MSKFNDLITIGFDKNGEANFEVRATIGHLDLERMNQLRAMIPVAISTAEEIWKEGREKGLSVRIAQPTKEK